MKRHIAALDAFRGIAALSVVSLHLTGQTALGSAPARGYLAVDFFFVLSGFVIASSYGTKLGESMSIIQFIRVRLIRLYPLVLLGLLLGFATRLVAYHFVGPQPNTPQNYQEIFLALGLGLFLLPDFEGPAQIGIFPLDGPVWSLMFEVIANMLYAFVRPLGLTAFRVIVLVSAVGLAISVFMFNGLNIGFTTATIMTGFPRVGYSFFVGVLTFHIYQSGGLKFLGKVPFWVLCLALLASLSISPSKFGWIYDLAVVLVLYPLIVAAGSQCQLSGRLAAVAIFMGRVSYPIYVLHDPLLAHLSHLHTSNDLTLVVLVVFLLAMIVAVGWAASAFYDEPVRLWLSGRRFKPTGIAAEGAD